MVRALAFHQCGPGLNPGGDTVCGLSLLLVLSLVREIYLRVLRFSPLLKNQHFQIPTRSEMVHKEPLCGYATTRSLFIYLFIYLFQLLFVFVFLYLLQHEFFLALKMSTKYFTNFWCLFQVSTISISIILGQTLWLSNSS